MRRFLTMLAARFLLRRLLTPKLLDHLAGALIEADKTSREGRKKREYAKRELEKIKPKTFPNYRINVAIELGVLTKKLHERR